MKLVSSSFTTVGEAPSLWVVLWLSWWLKETVPSNTTCCARCHAPAGLKGRYIGELDQSHFTCYAPVIVEPPTDLNVTEGMAAELKCRTGTSMTSVNWLTPNGTLIRASVGQVESDLKVLRTAVDSLVAYSVKIETNENNLESAKGLLEDLRNDLDASTQDEALFH